MARKGNAGTDNSGNSLDAGNKKAKRSEAGDPRSVAVGDAITTSKDFARFMSLLIGDIVSGRVDPKTANAACNAGGKLLQIVELEHKYGRSTEAKPQRDFVLATFPEPQ